MKRVSYLLRMLGNLEGMIQKDWDDYPSSPEEIREQLNLLREIANEISERNL